MAKGSTAAVVIELPRIDVRMLQIKLIGDSPLISHAWSDKAKKEMLDKQMKKAKTAKAAKDPWKDFCESLYWITPKPENPAQDDIDAATFGMPAVCFKSAAVDACSSVDGITKVQARGAFHVIGEMVPIIAGPPVMREDMVRVGMGTADIRYRGEFKEWAAELTVRFNANVLSAEQIVHIFNVSGFACGLGEWRPQRDGSHGMYHVHTSENER